ncbi:MAG: hypothetical protein ACXW0H_09220 [Methylobacter sp.]
MTLDQNPNIKYSRDSNLTADAGRLFPYIRRWPDRPVMSSLVMNS